MAVHFSYANFSETDLNIHCRNIDRKMNKILPLSATSFIN